MSGLNPMTYRLTDVAKAKLLQFCEISGMRPAEVARAAIHQFTENALQKHSNAASTLRGRCVDAASEHFSDKKPLPRAQEKLNVKYYTEDKKENNKEKSSSGPKPVSPSKTSSDSLTIPDSLDCSEFRQAWNDFIAHRKEIKKRFTDRAKSMTLKRLSKSTVKDAIEAIEASIANGWQGLDPDWTKSRNNFHESTRIQGPANDPTYYDDPV